MSHLQSAHLARGGDRDQPSLLFGSLKTIDLGGWLTGAYRIARPIAEEDLDEGQPREGAEELDLGAGKGKPS